MNDVKNKVWFDTSLPVFFELLCRSDIDPSADGVFLRDGFGRLAFYLRSPIGARALRALNERASQLLGSVASPLGVVQGPDGLGAKNVLAEQPGLRWLKLTDGSEVKLNLVDRRFYGQDWLAQPSASTSGSRPLLVFGSLKGGVGRSTALFVLANILSRKGKNVLMIDLDLEAPGLSSLFLSEASRPKYGVVDYLVESGLGGVDQSCLSMFVGESALTDRDAGQGRVDLIPAAGQATMNNPQDMLSKLARALVELPQPGMKPLSLGAQIKAMIQRFGERQSYDCILVDARAGLSELTAGPLLQLGGTVALFGTDSEHTFEGFSYLVAHLSTLPLDSDGNEWRDRIRFVHAKASAKSSEQYDFRDRLYDVLSKHFYERDEGEGTFTFSYEDAAAPHSAWRILFDGGLLDADFLNDPDLVDSALARAVFADFVNPALEALGFSDIDLGSRP